MAQIQFAAHLLSTQSATEEIEQPSKYNQVHTIVQINMSSTWNPDEVLGLSSTSVRVSTKLTRTCVVHRNEQQWSRRNGFDVVERVTVHELQVAGDSTSSRDVWSRPWWCEFTAGRTVEVVKFAVDCGGRVGDLQRCA